MLTLKSVHLWLGDCANLIYIREHKKGWYHKSMAI